MFAIIFVNRIELYDYESHRLKQTLFNPIPVENNYHAVGLQVMTDMRDKYIFYTHQKNIEDLYSYVICSRIKDGILMYAKKISNIVIYNCKINEDLIGCQTVNAELNILLFETGEIIMYIQLFFELPNNKFIQIINNSVLLITHDGIHF